MAYEILISSSVEKDLKKLDFKLKSRIYQVIDSLTEIPRPVPSRWLP